MEDKAKKSMAYRVGNDKDFGVGCGVSASFGQITDNRGVGVEEVCQLSVHLRLVIILTCRSTIASHSWLPGHTSRDQDNFSSLQCISKT